MSSFQYIASLLSITSGIVGLFGLMFVRNSMMGIVLGLVQVTAMTHVSDIATRQIRTIYALLVTVLRAAILCQPIVNHDFTIWGIAISIFGGLAFVCNVWLCIETPTFYLLRNDESKASKIFEKLQIGKNDLSQEFEWLKKMTRKEIEDGKSIFSATNVRSLWITMSFRILSSILLFAPLMTSGWIKNDSRDVKFIDCLLVSRIVYSICLVFVSVHQIERCFYPTMVVYSLIAVPMITLFYFLRDHVISFVVYCIVPIIMSVAADYLQFIKSVDSFSVTRKSWSLAFIGIAENVMNALLVFFYKVMRTDFLQKSFIVELIVVFISTTLWKITQKTKNT